MRSSSKRSLGKAGVQTQVKPLSPERQRCGLCGKTKALTETECCGRLICNDEHKYVTFSYARNSCSRNHRRMTLCGYHHTERHAGGWKNCSACAASFETEMYVWYGTNEYNFEKLENPPSYEPTRCSGCGGVIRLSEDEYSVLGSQYTCARCMAAEMKHRSRGILASRDRRARAGNGNKRGQARRVPRG